MKQKKKERFIDVIKGVQFFREDIEYIISRCQSQSINLVISDENNIFENIDELANYKGNRPSKIELKGKLETVLYSYIHISIESGRVIISTDGSEQLYSFGHELQAFIKSKIPWYYKVSDPWLWGAITILLIAFGLPIHENNSEIIKYQGTLWFVLFFGTIWLISIASRYFNFTINLSRKHEYGFFKKNSDKLILAFISSIIGAFIALLFSLLKNKF